ncbi:hypothetical protein E2493_10415 [Sphingomonas parva]|uniref:Uncharacterized protein n=1 Tax=Sphingomonas parva TaxID=2555898 RepID=A0A4Y8ZQU0_9SPHN|nr:hypothetical protein [Sphingomonas parva]TFI58388.1 hypothetical protein E2493_10415 [Sphingomonas parva]
MIRVIIGAVPAALAMFVIGFIFFASGLQNIASRNLDDMQAAAVQQSLAANLHGTGTYVIPNPEGSSAQTVMYGKGPVATVHYNSHGYPAMDAGALLGGLFLDFIVALLIGAALIGIDRRVPDFGSRARVVAIIAVAASAFMHLGEPIYYHHDWPHFIYLFIADAAALIAAGLIIARWFLPTPAREHSAALHAETRDAA